MTGVAAQITGRKAILSDLSVAATFIAYNYNNPPNPIDFERKAKEIIHDVEKECNWMYETEHSNMINGNEQFISNNTKKGLINYTVWSDVLICPYCESEYVFYDSAVIKETKKVKDDYSCPECNSMINKKKF